MSKANRVTLIVLDSVGIGALPDADEYGDEGANTLVHIAEEMDGLKLPNMAELGLGNLDDIKGVSPRDAKGVYGKMMEKSEGKDTTTGHWEIAGIVLDEPFRTYPDGFPDEVIDKFVDATGREILGNKAESGTVIIEELGEEHIKTGKPIVYTSADSVLQIAAHEDVIAIEELYDMCRKARKIMTDEHTVGRVIARPFIGEPGDFTRTDRREDFALEPPKRMMLDMIKDAGMEVMAVGKIEDIYKDRGITQSNHTVPNMESVDATLEFLEQNKPGLIFTNLVEFDMNYGHRNDAKGYAEALEGFDKRVPELIDAMGPEDVLIITADHGCDPTHPGTDHTREYIPVIIYGDIIKKDYDLGIRASFADLGATITDLLGVESLEDGDSFASEILK